MRGPKIRTFISGLNWCWHLKAANGEIVCWASGFASKSNAVRAAKRAKVLMQKAEIVK